MVLYLRRSKTLRDEAKYVIQNDWPKADEGCCFWYPAFWNLSPRGSRLIKLGFWEPIPFEFNTTRNGESTD